MPRETQASEINLNDDKNIIKIFILNFMLNKKSKK